MHRHAPQHAEELRKTVETLLTPAKGLLAADESLGTIGKRFKADGIESTAGTRRAYREMLFTAPEVGSFLSGVILFDETLRDRASDGTPFPRLLESQGILPGIKVDAGAVDMALHAGEKITEGLDGLGERLAEYKELGARFAKWRAVITVGDGLPSTACLEANAAALARYAALCQEAGLVPIVEPEVIMDGDHTIERCQEVTEATLHTTFSTLERQDVWLEGVLLKPNMVLPGQDANQKPSAEEVAQRTVQTFKRVVPAAVPGIVFLSGGQESEGATARLNAMNLLKAGDASIPWHLSFSFARALQNDAMQLWRGEEGNVKAAQESFLHRLRLNSAARRGEEYRAEMEQSAS